MDDEDYPCANCGNEEHTSYSCETLYVPRVGDRIRVRPRPMMNPGWYGLYLYVTGVNHWKGDGSLLDFDSVSACHEKDDKGGPLFLWRDVFLIERATSDEVPA